MEQEANIETQTQLLPLAVGLLALRKEKEQAEEKLKETKALLDNKESELIEEMRKIGIASFHAPEFKKLFVVSSRTKYSVKAEYRPDIIKWLQEHGKDDVVQSTVHHQSLQRAINELTDEDPTIELPLFVNAYTWASVSVRKK